MKNKEYLEMLLKKWRDGTMTKREFERLSEYIDDPDVEDEIKRIMDEDWKEMERKRNDSNGSGNSHNGFLFFFIVEKGTQIPARERKR